MELASMEGDWGNSSVPNGDQQSTRQCSLVDEGMKGGADPLLSQEPGSVLPSYASLMDTDVGHDFSDDKLLKSGNLYSLYLLNSDTRSQELKTSEGLADASSSSANKDKRDSGDTDEEIDVETDGGKDPSPEKVVENGHYDALFEGMPFTELKGKEVGPCSYCNLWRTIRFMSYCGRFPFCSVYCTKKFAVYKRERGELSEKTPEDIKAIRKLKVPTLFENQKARPLFPSSQPVEANSKRPRVCPNGSTEGTAESIKQFDWPTYLESLNSEAAPVKCFHHAPLAKEWKANLIGALIEVQNRDPDNTKDCFWIARIIKVAGYKAKLRFEGYGMDSSHDFWIHLCKAECYPVNGAEKAGKQLKPPKDVLEKLGSNWREHTTRVAHSGSPTFSIEMDKLEESLTSPFKKDSQLEVVYKRQVSSTCVATVKKVVADRIYVQYENCKDPSKDFWFHQTSPLIHPVGWSQRVHHPLIATAAYKAEALDKGRKKKGGPRDAPWEIFQLPKPIPDEQNFCVGMKLEAIDPLKLGSISVATVVQTLGDGYLMIAIDGCLHDVASWFCYHATSSSLLPIGFCEYHQIDLVPPRGYEGKFDWDDYLKATNSIAAPVELFHQKKVDPPFRIGQKLEAVDLIESGFICAATILKIAGPLLRVHFDGWDPSYDQWLNCQSPDIYPVGWCEMVGYPLQPPRVHDPANHVLPLPILKNGKKQKSTSSLHSHDKRKRSLSGSAGCFETSESLSSMVDAIYSFSDTEDHMPPKPPKALKKEKSEKHSRKERKSASSKDKKSKTKGHSKSKHKDDVKNGLQTLLSQSTPNLGSVKSNTSKKIRDASMPTMGTDILDGSFLESPLGMRLLPDSPLSSSLDSFTSLSNGAGAATSLPSSLPLDPLQMSPLTSTSDSGFQSVLAKASCSSLMSPTELTKNTKTEDGMNNGWLSPNGPSSSSSQSQRDATELSRQFPFLNSKHESSKHKSKKSKKSKKLRDKDKSKKEKKCKKKDKEKKRKCEARERDDKKASSDGKTSKLAALLSLPGQISFPDNKPLLNGFLNSLNNAVPPAPPKPKKSEPPDDDPFTFETEQEIQEKLLSKQTEAQKMPSTGEVSPVLLNNLLSEATLKKKSTVTKARASKAKRQNMSAPTAYQPALGIDDASKERSDGPFLGGSPPFKETIEPDEIKGFPSQPAVPQMPHGGSPVSVYPKHHQPSFHNPVNSPKPLAEPTPATAPALMELRKLPLNINPRDAQHLLRSLQWQDPNLYRQFLNLSASSAPFVPSRSPLSGPQRRDLHGSEPAVLAPSLRQSPQTVPHVINPRGMSPAQSPEEMMMLQNTVPMMRLPTENQLSKKQRAEQLPSLQDVISTLPRDGAKEKHPAQRMERPDGSSVKRQSPTYLTSIPRSSPSEQVLPSHGPFPTNPQGLVSPQTAPSPHTISSPHMVPSPHTASSPHSLPSPHTVLAPSPHGMISPQFPPGGPQALPSPHGQSPGIPSGFPHHATHQHAVPPMLTASRPHQEPHPSQAVHKQAALTGGAPGTPSTTHRLPPLETILKSLNSAASPANPAPGSDASVSNHRGMRPATIRPSRPRLTRPHSFPDASIFQSVSMALQLPSSSFPSPTSAGFPYSSPSNTSSVPKSLSISATAIPTNPPKKTKTQSSSVANPPTLSRSSSVHSAPRTCRQITPTFPTLPPDSQASCTSSFKLTGFQPTSGTLSSAAASSKLGGTSIPSSPSSSSRTNSTTAKNNPSTPRSKLTTPSTPTDSGPGCIVEEFTLQKMVRPEIGIMNPWKWGVAEVVQFLIDAGERGCVETFTKQSIDGKKFMSLTKDQIAKLTGMKVAPSLKIYQQIVRLRTHFPSPD